MDKTELKTIATTLAAVSATLKTCRSGEKALQGHIGMGSEEGITLTLQALQAAARQLSTHTRAFTTLIEKASMASTATSILAAAPNSEENLDGTV